VRGTRTPINDAKLNDIASRRLSSLRRRRDNHAERYFIVAACCEDSTIPWYVIPKIPLFCRAGSRSEFKIGNVKLVGVAARPSVGVANDSFDGCGAIAHVGP
jgi:hypothetical protein